MTRAARPIALAAGVVATIALLWLTGIPLGVPGEWTWSRILPNPEPGAGAELFFGLLQSIIAAAAYLGFVAFVAARLESVGPRAVGVCLALLVGAGFAWLWMIQDSPPAPHGLHKVPLVLYSPGTSGYFFHARYEMGDAAEFVRGYQVWVSREGDPQRVLHFGTHPPGLFLFHHVLNRLCDASPGLSEALIATQPESVREGLDLFAQQPLRGAPPLTPADRASLWLAALITQFAAAATVVPLYFLLRRTAGREASYLGAALWPLVPALAIFLPKSDALYPFLGMLFVWCWVEACSRRSLWLAVVAGVVLALAMCVTLAFLPVALLAAVLTFVVRPSAGLASGGTAKAGKTPAKAIVQLILAGGLGFAAVLGLVWLVGSLNLPAVWIQNLRNHAAFYSQYTRTSWKWLLVNPVELTLALGWPVMMLAVSTLITGRGERTDPAGRERWLTAVACAAVWAILWLSGKNSGEAARLWLLVMPWWVWMAAGRVVTPRAWLVVGGLQAAVCIATVLRVTGFDFG